MEFEQTRVLLHISVVQSPFTNAGLDAQHVVLVMQGCFYEAYGDYSRLSVMLRSQ